MADITMPQLGETVTEGTIIKWFKNVGDQVAEDETLFEVSTDKVDSEVPSAATGYITEILVAEGETVDVGAKLAVISDQPSGGGDAKADAPKEEPEPAPEESAKAEPAAKADAAPLDSRSEGAARAPAGTDEDAVAPKKGRAGSSKLLSPVVRKLISEHDLDPEQMEGTGQGGRITRADVLAFIDRGAAAAKAPAAGAPAAAAQKPAAAQPSADADREVVPFSNIRKRTAEHMMRSLETSAHVLTVTEVDFEGVERARRRVREEFKAKEGFSLTYLPFVARAVVDAVTDFPHVNASVDDNQLIVHKKVHLGIAVDLRFEGLIVPVIHNADSQRLRALARAGAELARRARSRELSADDISGGTFTITNPGPFGTFITAPIISQPQVAILSTDGVKKRPVAVELPDGSDAIVVHHVGNLALSFDHRAFDGAYAAAFLGRTKEILETRDWSAEL